MTTFSKDLETAYRKARSARAALAEANQRRDREHQAWMKAGAVEGPAWEAFRVATGLYVRAGNQAALEQTTFEGMLHAELFGGIDVGDLE